MRDVFCQRICDMVIDEAWQKIKENERSFDKDDEQILKSIADKFEAESIADVNLNYDSWHEEEEETDD